MIGTPNNIYQWGEAQEQVVDALSLESFKARLDGAFSNLI